MNPLKRLALAASFVTCLPFNRSPVDWETMGALSKYLSCVGFFIGLSLCSFVWLLDTLHASSLLTGVVLTLIWLGTTGGIHFDGLMDTADGIYSHRDPKRMLEIMHDSRVGNFGALTGFAVLLLKIACLSSFNSVQLLQIVLVVPAWSRFCETFAIGAFPYLRESGMGKIWHDTTKFPRDIFIASVVPLVVTAIANHCGWRLSVIAALCTVAGGLIASYRINGILKGHTGDTYGAVVEISEVVALLSTALAVSSGVL